MKAAALILPFLFHTLTLSGQSTSRVTLLVKPPQSIVKIDTLTVRQYGAVVQVAPGTHRLQMWAPKRVLVDTTVTIEPGASLVLRRQLLYTPEWRQFKADLSAYRIARSSPWLFSGGAVISTGALVFTQVKVFKARKEELLDRAALLQQDWIISPDAQEDARIQAEMQAVKKDFSRMNAMRWASGIGLGGAALFLGWRAVRNFSKAAGLEEPQWRETPLLSGIQLDPLFSPGGMAGAQLTFHF